MRHICTLLGLCLLPSLAAPTAVWSADRFESKFALDLDGQAAHYAVVLPREVYAASLRNDLGDLRVLNGAGEPVPYSFEAPRAPAQPQQPPPSLRSVKWFPVPLSDTGTQGAPPQGAPLETQLGVTIAADGSLRAAVTTTTTKTTTTTTVPQRSGRDADLVDLGPPNGLVSALLVHLANDNYQGRVSVEASSDLRSWQPVIDTQLLKITYGGDTLTQERIELGDLRARYLRLRWPDGAPDIASLDVKEQTVNTSAPESAAPPTHWREGLSARPGNTAGEYLFETDGAYPVELLRLSLPQLNTVARVSLFSRTDANAPWRTLTSSVVYRLQGKAGELESPPLEIAANTAREWRITVDMRGGGLGAGLLTVAVGWHPALLTFVARGAPPFALAVGNASLGSNAVSRSELLVGAASNIATARVGAALPVPPPEPPVVAPVAKDTDAERRYILWGALLLAVGALGAMAWRLSRTTSSGNA